MHSASAARCCDKASNRSRPIRRCCWRPPGSTLPRARRTYLWRVLSRSRAPLPAGSLQILYLLAELLDHVFELQPDVGQFHIIRLGTQRVRFAIELLGEEIQSAADRSAFSDQPFRLRDMRGKAVQFFADVGFARNQNSFLMQTI